MLESVAPVLSALASAGGAEGATLVAPVGVEAPVSAPALGSLDDVAPVDVEPVDVEPVDGPEPAGSGTGIAGAVVELVGGAPDVVWLDVSGSGEGLDGEPGFPLFPVFAGGAADGVMFPVVPEPELTVGVEAAPPDGVEVLEGGDDGAPAGVDVAVPGDGGAMTTGAAAEPTARGAGRAGTEARRLSRMVGGVAA